MAISTTGQWGSLADPSIQKIYNAAGKEHEMKYNKVFKVMKTNRPDIKSRSWTGLGLFQVKNQGGSIPSDSPIQGYSHTTLTTVYALGFAVSREMIEDDQHMVVIKKFPEALKRSSNASIETIGALVIDRAFNASYTGNDAKALCATDHPLIGGGTFSNMAATPADLDMTSLEQALTVDIPALTDDRGIMTPVMPRGLLVHPANSWTTSVLLKSQGNPESANRGINPAQGIMPEETIVWHYLTDPDAWFIRTDAPDGLEWYWQREPDFAKDNDTDTQNAKWVSTFRSATLWDNPRSIYGSAGA